MTRNSGAFLVRWATLHTKAKHGGLTCYPAEHARLKDHVAQMDGQLDAQIQEGGKHVADFGLSRVHSARVSLHHWESGLT